VNIGIIGLGFFADYHVRAAALVPGINVTAVSRRNEEALRAFCKIHAVKGYPDYYDLLKDESIDAVLIATPHHLHTHIVEAAAESGKHILLEKPLAESPDGVSRIIKAVNTHKICCMVGFSNHFTRANRIAKDIIDSGEIGEIITGTSIVSKYWMVPERRDWHLTRKTGGGMWLTIGVHMVDRLAYFTGSRISSISAILGTKFHDQDAHDTSSAFLRFKNGASGFVSAIGYNKGGPIEETFLVGSKGSLKINQRQGVSIGKNDSWSLIDGSGSTDPHVEALKEEWRVFNEYVETGESGQYVNMDFAVHIMDVIFAGERSYSEKREVGIDS